MFHEHRWTEHARMWAPPISHGPGDELSGGEEAMKAFSFGVTTIIFRCADDECCELKKVEAYGHLLVTSL